MNAVKINAIKNINTLDELAEELLTKYAVVSVQWYNRLYGLDEAYWDGDWSGGHVAVKQKPEDFLSNFNLMDYLEETGNYGDKYGYYISCLKHLQEEVDTYKDRIDLLYYQTADTGDTEDYG